MAIIKSGATSDQLTIDPTSKAARITLYDSSGREVSGQKLATFAASAAFTPAAAATDIVTITGSASKVVKVFSFILTTTNGAAGSQLLLLIKRSTADSAGTPVAGAAVPYDSNDVATATVNHYTANPTLGNAIGTINTLRVASPIAVGASFAGVVFNAGVELIPKTGDGLVKPVTLRGVGQQLVINLNGATLLGTQTHAYTVVWTEE